MSAKVRGCESGIKKIIIMDYNIRLEKYKSRNQKRNCPQCNKNTFVPYYDYANNCYINDNVGRCDREIECGYHYKPKEYFKDNPTDDLPRTFVPKQRSANGTNGARQRAESKKIQTISFDYIKRAMLNRNNQLKDFLQNLFPLDIIENTFDKYFVGSTKDGRIVYPLIDRNGEARTAKVMLYDPKTGKRIKDEINSFDWLHTILDKKGLLPDGFAKETCLFGEHLISLEENKDKIVNILESEKSALIASMYQPQHIWMASGGMNSLNVGKLQALRGEKIILHPDADTTNIAFDKWSKIMQEARQMGFEIGVSTLLKRICTPEQKAKGYDLGDYIIDDMKSQKTEISQPIEVRPQENIPTNLQNEALNTMINKNPVLMDLINKFDLTLIQITNDYAN